MVVPIQKVPDALFSTVTMVRDLRKAMILDRKQVGRGEPDVVLVSPLGIKEKVTRESLLKNYVEPNGRKIKISRWRYNTGYLVVANTQQQMALLKVPKKSKTTFELPNKKVAKAGEYILCPLQNGAVVKQRAFTIEKAMFNKMFIINKKPSKKDLLIQELKSKAAQIIPKSKDINNTEKVSVEIKLTVTKRLLNRNTGKIVGFEVFDGKMYRNLKVAEVAVLCRAKKFANITIVEKDGKEFLRGVGMRIENLPAVMI